MDVNTAFNLLLGFNLGLFVSFVFRQYRVNKANTELKEAENRLKESFRELKKAVNEVKSLDNLPPDLPDEAVNKFDERTLPPEVIQRFQKISELSQQAASLAASHNEPQRSALDGRDKQRNAGRFKMIQDEIQQNLEAILKMGYDLKVMTFDGNTGERKVERLSNILQHMKGGKPGPNLSLVKGDDDDKGPTTH